jgi:hypothetical protein
MRIFGLVFITLFWSVGLLVFCGLIFFIPEQLALRHHSIQGSDLMWVLFCTPFAALMLGLWIAADGALRERFFRPVAGGVKIITDGMSTRVRLSYVGAVGLGLMTTGGLGFVSTFIVGVSTKMHPPVGLVVAFIAAVYLSGMGVFLRQRWKIRLGMDDLVINKAERTLDLPQSFVFGRKQRITVSIADIESLTVEKVSHYHQTEGTSYTYDPTLRLCGTEPREQELASWKDKLKADDFADWLRKELGL